MVVLLTGPPEPPAPGGERGIIVERVESEYQAGPTQVRVLLPGRTTTGRLYPVVYVLPVEPGGETRYGDGLLEAQRRGLPDTLQAIFVAPTFADLPWYADHPSNPRLRQETYFLRDVIPRVEARYPARREPSGRLLLGFSKSGWGAYSLLLRHPDLFGKAAAWDAPLMLDRPGRYGSGPIFGSAGNFAEYRVSTLLERQARALGDRPRLILLGYGNFRPDHEAAHALLQRLHVPHVYRDGPQREHVWESGWVAEAAAFLLAD
jgi:S-formylglutathione hydrolase FrmB